VAVCGALVSRFAGLSPRGRNLVWLGFLGAAAILPAVSLAALLPQATPTVARVDPAVFVAAAAPASVPDVAAAPDAAPSPVLQLAAWAVWPMVGLCATIALALIVRLALAAAAARRLVRAARPVSL